MMEDFHFLRPLWLLAIFLAVALFIVLQKSKKYSFEWQNVIAPHLLPYLLDGKHRPLSQVPLYLLLLLWIVASFALAGPTWEKLPQPLLKNSNALVVVFDQSPSMMAEDLKPSRLVRARLKLIDLLNSRDEGLTALIVYSGEAHVVTPLTDDVETIKNLLPSISPGIMPEAGSNIEMAHKEATQLLKDAGISQGNILFITDGIAIDALDELGKHHRAFSHRVAFWGFGTKDGAPIPLAEGGFARNQREIIVATLDEHLLSEAAVRMGGVYIPFTETAEDIENIHMHLLSEIDAEQRKVEREFDQWVEFGPWLIVFILPLAALSFRRGLLIPCLLCVIYLAPQYSQANETVQNPLKQNAEVDNSALESEPVKLPGLWDKLWFNSEQLGQKLLNEGQAKQAADYFKQPERKASANYRAQSYEEAAKLFDENVGELENTADRANSFYNKGTALTQAGKYDEAIAAFDKSLEFNAELTDARHNKEIAEKLKELEEQQQQKNQNKENQKNQDQNSQEQNQDQQQSSQAENQQENNSSSDSQDQQNSDQQQDQQASKDSQNQDQDSSDQKNQGQSKQNQEKQNQENQQAKQDFQKQMEQAEKNQQRQGMQQPDKDESEAQRDEQQSYYTSEQEELTEDEQSLEQWLRKVPDDPGRILRNKFLYETRQRKMELDTRRWNTNDNRENERW